MDQDWPKKRKKNIFVSINSNQTRAREFPKKIANKFKKLKNIILTSFQAKKGRDRPKKIEKKNFRSNPSLPNPSYRLPKKIAKKIKKHLKTSSWLHLKPKRVRTGQK